jgi:hypothetical protein
MANLEPKVNADTSIPHFHSTDGPRHAGPMMSLDAAGF